MNILETRQIGCTKLQMPVLGLRANPLGGLYEPVYGYGNAERNVGFALKDLPRDKIFISTKVGRLLLDPNDPATPAAGEDVMVTCDDHRVSLKAAAIQFPLHHKDVASVLMGPRTPEHVTDNIKSFEEKIPDALWPDPRIKGV